MEATPGDGRREGEGGRTAWHQVVGEGRERERGTRWWEK
jgi:hypothetical protein